MSDLPIDQNDLDQDYEAITRVLTMIHGSTFRGAGAKSIVEVLNFLEVMRNQVLNKMEPNNGTSEKL